MPRFFERPNLQEGLMQLIAQMQARRMDPIAEGITSAAGSIGQALGIRGQESRRQATDENRILAQLAAGGQLEIPTGTIRNGQKVWDQPSPGSIPLKDLFPGLK